MEEDKTDSMLWLGPNKLLKILIGDENMVHGRCYSQSSDGTVS